MGEGLVKLWKIIDRSEWKSNGLPLLLLRLVALACRVTVFFRGCYVVATFHCHIFMQVNGRNHLRHAVVD